MKNHLLIKTMLLLCALVVGSSNMWAETATITFSNQASGTSDSSTAYTTSNFVSNGITSSSAAFGTITCSATEKCYSGKTGYGMKAGAASSAGSFTITFSTPLTNVSQITLNRASFNANTANITIKNGTTTLANAVSTPSGSTDFSDMDITSLSIASLTGLTVETSKYCYIKSITITYTPSSNPTCVAPSFSPAAGTYTSAQSVTLSSETTGATIYYTIGENHAAPTTSSTLYENAIAVNATTTIKAIAVKDGHNNSSVATATYTILGHAGTEADPFTVADARTAIDANAGCTTGVYATGIVSKIVTAYKSSKITFNISADGLTTSDQLQAFQCITGSADASQVHPGDVVIISGNLTKYSNTYEFASGCQVQSIEHATTPSIDANNVTLDYNATSGEVGYIVYHPTSASLSAALTDGDWISNVAVDEENNKVTFDATANTGVQRTATITLSYTNAADKVVTVTQKKCAYATPPFAFDGGRSNLEAAAGFTQSGLGTDYDNSPKLKFDTTGDNVILRINESGTLSFDIKGNDFCKGSTSTFKVQTSVDGETYDDLATYTKHDEIIDLGATATKTFELNSSVRYIKWVYTEKGATNGGNVALGNIIVSKLPEPSNPVVSGNTVTLSTTSNMAGWRTYDNNTAKKYTVDGTTKVYYASATGDSKVTLTEIEGGVPANTTVILHQTSGTTITLTETDDAITAPASNLLAVSTANQNLGTVYRLGYKAANGIGFYTYTSASAPAGVIYIASVNAAREFLAFAFDDEDVTGIDASLVNSEERTEKSVFDLQGRKVANPTRGLYIVNGKKVIVK